MTPPRLTDPSPPEPSHLVAAPWADAVAALRAFSAARGSADVSVRIRAHGVDLGRWVAACRDDYWSGLLSPQQIADVESVNGWSWHPERPGSWRRAYNALARYCDEHGTAILVGGTDDDVDLQAWTAEQRHDYLSLRMPASRLELLRSLPDWQFDPDLARWEQGLAVAKRYVRDHGTLANVRRDTRVGTFQLGHWIQRCREDRRAGTLDDRRRDEVQTLPGWDWAHPQQKQWDDGLQALRRFTARAGHAAPSQHEVVDGFPVGQWVTKRRRDHRLGRLEPDREAMLEALPGWDWDPLERRWRRGLSMLEQYVAVHGHARPSRSERLSGFPVGDWVRAQRVAFQKGRLPAERVDLLQRLAGWTWQQPRASADGSHASAVPPQ